MTPLTPTTYRTLVRSLDGAARRYGAMSRAGRYAADRRAVTAITTLRERVSITTRNGAVRRLVGPSALVTGNTKLDKGVVPTVGIAHLPADRIRGWVAHQVRLAPDPETLACWQALAALVARLDMCPWRTPSCSALCLASSGHYGLGAGDGAGAQTAAQGWRLTLLIIDPDAWVAATCRELRLAARRVRKAHGRVLAFRPSVLDDLLHPESLLTLWRDVVAAEGVRLDVYRYSKAPEAMLTSRTDHVTLSWHERRKGTPIALARRTGRGVATVAMPGVTFPGVRVIDGDVDDYRPGDDVSGGAIVRLTVKQVTDGRAMGPMVAAARAAGFIIG